MAMILITDTPQGGACRCEGQAQALDLAKLNPEHVEALKQALGINANASQGAGQADFSALSPEQVEALKQALGVSEEQAVFDPEALSEENVVALREKIFDIVSSDRKFHDRNWIALQNLFTQPSALGEYAGIPGQLFELAIGENPQGNSWMVYNNTYIELSNQQEVESVARKAGVNLGTSEGMTPLKSVVELLLAGAVSSDRQIDALKAELAELKAQLNAGQ